MELIRIYQCLCDRTRLRILHLLTRGPLCVCHVQEILGEPQVKVSRHLGYLKTRRLVEVAKRANWRVYRLPARPTRELRANLRCLQDCCAEDRVFRRDDLRLRRVRARLAVKGPGCSPLTLRANGGD